MKTRAAIAWAAGKPLEVVEVDLDGPKAGEVLVEIRATGVCHTDEFTRSGGDPEGLFPVIFGHEGAGIVVDVGPGVRSLKKGDHVIVLAGRDKGKHGEVIEMRPNENRALVRGVNTAGESAISSAVPGRSIGISDADLCARRASPESA